MIKIIVGRLLQLIPVLWMILTLTFFMSKEVPGGPFSAERQATPEVIARLNAYYGLDQPLWKQYLGYLGKFCPLRFGSFLHVSKRVCQRSDCAFFSDLVADRNLGFLHRFRAWDHRRSDRGSAQEQGVGLYCRCRCRCWGSAFRHSFWVPFWPCSLDWCSGSRRSAVGTG